MAKRKTKAEREKRNNQLFEEDTFTRVQLTLKAAKDLTTEACTAIIKSQPIIRKLITELRELSYAAYTAQQPELIKEENQDETTNR